MPTSGKGCPSAPKRSLHGKALNSLSFWSLRQAAIFVFLLAVGMGSASASPLFGQDDHRNKLPGLDKITSGGPTRQAFTGKVKSFDRKHDVLSLNTVEGADTEIFPLKKKVKVTSANGKKLKLAALKPGASVTVFYELRSDRRTVEQIIVLSDVVQPAKKQEHHPS
jgi:hypothetical protein